MTGKSAADFLVRAVLDEAFRDLALSNPQRAFEGFDLTEEEKEILRVRDHRVLGLLGDVVRRQEAVAEPPVEKAPATGVAQTLPGLAEVKLLLRLVPQVVGSPGSEPKVSYAASLHPWPVDDEPEGGAAPTENGAEAEAAEVRWLIRIAPEVVESRDTGLAVAYSASIHPVTAEVNQTGPADRAAPPETTGLPWKHHVDSPAVRSAAQAVQAADASQRYAKLLELVHALQTGVHGG